MTVVSAARAERTEKLLIAYEGGAVYTTERDGQYLLIINETEQLGMLDAEDRDGIDAVKEIPFPSAAARDEYIRSADGRALSSD